MVRKGRGKGFSILMEKPKLACITILIPLQSYSVVQQFGVYRQSETYELIKAVAIKIHMATPFLES
jgi:hypothetical protein